MINFPTWLLVLQLISQSFVGLPEKPKYDHRLDDTTLQRANNVFPYVKQAHYNYDIPPWVMLGIVQAETNIRPLMGDNGQSFGHGQIRCSTYSWLSHVNHPSYQHCHDLLEPEVNFYVMSEVLRFLKQKDGYSWKDVIVTYHYGYLVPHSQDKLYLDMVQYFGKWFTQYYKVWVQWNIAIETTEMTLIQWNQWLKELECGTMTW